VYTIIQENYSGDKQKSYKNMRMNIFEVLYNVKQDIENIIGLTLSVVKPKTVQVTNLHKIMWSICPMKEPLSHGYLETRTQQ
jgi:hypothetical protein